MYMYRRKGEGGKRETKERKEKEIKIGKGTGDTSLSS